VMEGKLGDLVDALAADHLKKRLQEGFTHQDSG